MKIPYPPRKFLSDDDNKDDKDHKRGMEHASGATQSKRMRLSTTNTNTTSHATTSDTQASRQSTSHHIPSLAAHTTSSMDHRPHAPTFTTGNQSATFHHHPHRY
jgi:hypothetical protein